MAVPHKDDVVIAPGVSLSSQALTFTFARSSGPGGQNVNKVNTKALLRIELEALREVMPPWAVARFIEHNRRYVSGDHVSITSSASSSQSFNRADCLRKLRERIILAMHRPRNRKPTRPTRGSVQRRLDHKKKQGQRKAGRQTRRDASEE